MNFCTNCGAELGVGRFCTNCGAPISGVLPPDFPSSTAVRPPLPPEPEATTVRPVAPPPVTGGSRYPLYADQAVLAKVADRLQPTPPPRRHASSNRSWVLPIVLLVLAMLAAASAGVWLSTRDSGDPDDVAGQPTPSAPISREPSPTAPSPIPRDDGQVDLAPLADVEGPPPVPPGLDLANNRVTYPATNMLDENPQSAYRIPGDATSSVITFRLPEEHRITEVGLVNGYAKVDTRGGNTINWYDRNRRILRVEWRFDDGTSVVQDLESTREMQLLEIDPLKTQTIELTILEVSPPGAGPLSKNVTAISDVLIVGS
jgi:hypothetical protein